MGHSKSKSRRRESSHFTNQRLPTSRVDHYRRSVSPRSEFDGWEAEPRYVTHTAEPVRSRRKTNLRLVEDRRQWHPDGPRRAATAFNRFAPRLIVPKWAALGGAAVTSKIAFSDPSSVAICIRRKTRREVIFAKRKSGRRGQRRLKRNWFSKIHCRR